jgi:hypothetical protein
MHDWVQVMEEKPKGPRCVEGSCTGTGFPSTHCIVARNGCCIPAEIKSRFKDQIESCYIEAHSCDIGSIASSSVELLPRHGYTGIRRSWGRHWYSRLGLCRSVCSRRASMALSTIMAVALPASLCWPSIVLSSISSSCWWRRNTSLSMWVCGRKKHKMCCLCHMCYQFKCNTLFVE